MDDGRGLRVVKHGVKEGGIMYLSELLSYLVFRSEVDSSEESSLEGLFFARG